MTQYEFTDKLNRKLNVREEADKDAPIAHQIESGTLFEGEADGDWVKVENGFVMASLVVEVKDEPEETIDDEAEESPLEKMSLPELRELAEASGIKLKSNMRKAEIIKALLDD